MQITITYKYTQQLSDQLYIETGKRITEHQETFSDEDLTPAARKASLTARRQTIGSVLTTLERLVTVETVIADRSLDVAAGAWSKIAIEVPGAEQAPTRSEALAVVERELISAAERAGAVQARYESLKAERERRQAEETEAERQKDLELPLNYWIEGKPGERKVNWYRARGPNLNQLAENDQRFAELAQRVEAEAARQNAEHAATVARNHAAERALLVECGTASQVERFDAGVLPEQEFDEVARGKLFASLDVLPRYQRIEREDVARVLDCDCHSIKFANDDADEHPLTAEQWEALSAVRRLAPQGSTVDVRNHRGYCADSDCDGEVSRLAARVTVEFAGETYRQEYAL